MNWVELGGDGDGVSHAPTDPVVLRLRRYVQDAHGAVVPHADLGSSRMSAVTWALGFVLGLSLGAMAGFFVAAVFRSGHRR